MLVIGFSLLTASPVLAQKWQDFSSYTPANQDEAEVVELLKKWQESISNKDTVLHLSLFAENASVITSSGKKYKGQKELVELLDSFLFPVVQSFKIEKIKIVIAGERAKVETEGVTVSGYRVSTEWIFEKKETKWIIKEEINHTI